MNLNDENQREAFIVGLQIMAIIAGAAISIIGIAVGVNYFVESLPFFVIGIFAPLALRGFKHEA